jgi:hypothetical protein
MKKKFLLAGFSVFAIVGMLFAMFPQESQAIPPFARKYKTACTTCHWGTFPRLNAFGKAFHASGLRMPGGSDEVFVKDEPVAMGASAWSRLFPKAVWPGEIPGLPPIGVLSKFNFNVVRERPQDFRGSDDGGSPQRNFDSEFSGFDDLEVLVAATFGETLSFFYAGMWGESERAYINYAPFINGEQGLVNLRIGKLDLRSNPMSNHLKQIRNRNYLMNEMPVIAAGNLFGWHPGHNGIEFWGSKNGPGGKGGLEWAVGIVNGAMGDGEGHLIGDGDTRTIADNVIDEGVGLFTEINNGKDYYAMVSYKIGGMGVLGETSVDDSLVAKENWQDNSIKIKGYYYGGTTGTFISADGVGAGNPLIGRAGFELDEDTLHGATTGSANSLWVNDANHFKRFGVVLEANWWNFAFMGAASFMEDDITGDIIYDARDGLPREVGDNFDTSIYTGEVNWVALPWLIPSARIEHVDPDYDVRDIQSFTRYTFETRLITRANININVGGSWSSYLDSQTGVDGADVPQYDLQQAADDAFWIQTEVAF